MTVCRAGSVGDAPRPSSNRFEEGRDRNLPECLRRRARGRAALLAAGSVAGLLFATPTGLPAQEKPDPPAQEEAARDTIAVLPPLRAEVRRTLLDPGLARSIERLEPGRELLAFHDLGDWLASRGSVGVRGYGGGGRQVLSVRGGRPEGVLVLLDGLPLNDPLTGEADLASVPLATLESATLVRGAAAARYGSGALGGALLLETASVGAAEPRARLAVGSFGRHEASGSAGWSHADVGIEIGAGLLGAENDFDYTDPGAPTDPADPGARSSPELRRENADSEATWLRVAAETGTVRATLRHDVLDRGVPGRIGTNAFAGDRWHESRWTMSGTVADMGAGRSVRGGLRRVAMRYAPVDGAPSEQRALDGRLGGELPLPALFDLVVAGRVSFERLAGDDIAGVPQRLSGGLTLRRVLHPGAGIGIEPLVGFDVAGGETALSPEIGAWFRPDERVRLYGRLGRAYRVPTFADLHFEAAPGVRASPDLEAERVVLDAELGAEASVEAGTATSASARLALWSRDTRRPIVWLASSAALWSPKNLERLSAHGLDLELGIERASGERSGAHPSLGWAVEAGLTLQRSRLGFGTNRNPLPYQPDVTARASAELRRGLTAGRLQATWTGSRTTSVAATRRLDGFLKVDVGLRRRFTPGSLVLDATLGVENLLDRRYQLVELFPEPGRALNLTLDIR